MKRPAPSRVRLYDEHDLDSVLRSMARQAMACLPTSEVALVGFSGVVSRWRSACNCTCKH